MGERKGAGGPGGGAEDPNYTRHVQSTNLRTTIKDTQTKPRGVESGEGGGDGWDGGRGEGKRQKTLYLNNNKIKKKKNL